MLFGMMALLPSVPGAGCHGPASAGREGAVTEFKFLTVRSARARVTQRATGMRIKESNDWTTNLSVDNRFLRRIG
jgi:hypothetical protein